MSAVLTAASVIRRLLQAPVRIALSVLLGGLFTIIALAIRFEGSGANLAGLVMGGLLGFVIPIIALVHAVGSLGDPYDDGTLVYLWLKPMPRWQLAVGALLATWSWVLPITALIVVAVTVAGGETSLLLPALVACTGAAMAYSSLFVGLGLRTTRSLLAGLVFVLIWEGFLAALSDGIATWTVRRWSSALFDDLAGRFFVSTDLPEASTLAASVVLLTMTAVGVALSSRWLGTRDVP